MKKLRAVKAEPPVLLMVTSDQHCGSTVALCPHRISLDDGGHYEASKAQRWLWECWQETWDEAAALKKEHGAKLYTVFNGDMTEGDHHGTTQILSGNAAAQAAVVDACMKPVLATKPDQMWFIRGTEAHVGKSACYEERIARGLLKDGWPVVQEDETGNASHWEAVLEIQGVRLNFMHHGKVGAQPWTRGNVTSSLAAATFYDHCAQGRPYPHLAIRSHMHQYVDTGDIHPTRVLQTGAFQLKTAFTHRIATTGRLADIGGYRILIRDGEADVKRIQFKPEGPSVWRA